MRVESKGVVLAETSSPVLCFETGLPTRYYIDRTDVDFTHLVPSDTQTECPYKGTTSGYWSANVELRIHPDIAWTYDFPTRDLLADCRADRLLQREDRSLPRRRHCSSGRITHLS